MKYNIEIDGEWNLCEAYVQYRLCEGSKSPSEWNNEIKDLESEEE